MTADTILVNDIILWGINTRELNELQKRIFYDCVGSTPAEFSNKMRPLFKTFATAYEKDCAHSKCETGEEEFVYFANEMKDYFAGFLYDNNLREEHDTVQYMDEATAAIRKSILTGNVLKLPEQLPREVYLEVKGKLELIGGKWKGGKVSGFVIPEEHLQHLVEIRKGTNINLKKEHQFFETSDVLADSMVVYLEIQPDDLLCEPSAGQGALIDAVLRSKRPFDHLFYCENMILNQNVLANKYLRMGNILELQVFNDDFLQHSDTMCYDKIIANPPFSKNQDIQHIRKMYSVLKPGGRIVTIASTHWERTNNKTEREFREWLSKLNAEIIDVEAGAFKESGTKIATKMIIIDKPKNAPTVQQSTLF